MGEGKQEINEGMKEGINEPRKEGMKKGRTEAKNGRTGGK
jgi:hypothetical protein